MVGFGYGGSPFGDKKFSFGSVFPNSSTLNQNTQNGAVGQEAYFDVRNYGNDERARDKALGRMMAGSAGAVLTDSQLQNLGSGIAAIKDLVNQRTAVDGGVGSLNNAGALTDDRLNQYVNNGDLLGATGWSDMDGGSAFGTMRANAQAAKAAGDQNAYSGFTNAQNFYNLADLGARTMGGVGGQMFNQSMITAGNEASANNGLGKDPYEAAGSGVFGQGQSAKWTKPHQAPPTDEGNAPSPPATPVVPDQPSPGLVGNNGGDVGSAFGGSMPDTGMPLDDLNKRISALEGAFTEAQGTRPDPAQLNYLTRIANDQGLDAAVNFAKNNIVVKAIKASGKPAPKIRNSQDVNGALDFHDFIVNALGPEVINQPREEYARNLLSWYQQNGM